MAEPANWRNFTNRREFVGVASPASWFSLKFDAGAGNRLVPYQPHFT
jgi:hypothetical protein